MWVEAQRVDDPAVRVRVVADVVERDVRAAYRPRPSATDDVDLEPLLSRTERERAAFAVTERSGKPRSPMMSTLISTVAS